MSRLAERVIVDQLRAGAPARWTVRGSSMWPTIRDGATVAVEPDAGRALRVGELVAFARGDSLVVHRVAGVSPAGLRCQGDALAWGDGAVPWADVLGRARVVAQRPLSLRWPRAGELRALCRAAIGALRAGRA